MRFYRIKIGDIYLTRNGLMNGDACKLKVIGADALLNPFRQTIRKSLNFTPKMKTFNAGTKGIDLTIEVETYVLKAVWEDLIELKNTAVENKETLNIIGTGDIGNFNVEALPLEFTAPDFENGRILKPVFRFVTT